jgi:hypothetical protein
MKRRACLVVVLLAVAISIPLAAEKVNMTPQELRQTATHVVVGKVVAVYTRVETIGDWEYTRCLAEVRVDAGEKGDGLEPGALVYVRYWHRRFLGRKPPASTAGHRGRPAEGETLRIYLARNAYDGFGKTKDGGFNVIGANGFEKIE